MTRLGRPRPRGEAFFTLIELMIVILVILVTAFDIMFFGTVETSA